MVSNKRKQLVLVWMVLSKASKHLTAFGNGKQWQYPVFPTRKEAKAWIAEDTHNRGRIVRASLEYETSGRYA